MKRLQDVLLTVLLVKAAIASFVEVHEPQSHRGKVFLLGFLEMEKLEGISRIYVTSKTFGEISVYVPGLNLTETRSVVPGISTKIDLPTKVRMQGFGKESKGILLTSNVTVSVYATNARKYDRDVFVVFPTSALGKEHVVAMFTPKCKSLVGVIASTDNTLVQIRLNTEGSIIYSGKVYSNGDVVRVFLNKLETFQLQHAQDLTGTIVISSQPVAVLSGNIYASVPHSDTSASHLAVQIPSLSKWGKNFITTPIENRKEGDVFRIVVAYNETVIAVKGRSNVTLNVGEFHEFELGSKERTNIICSKPAMLVQFNKGSLTRIHSDSFMLVVPPTEQYTNNYDFVIPVDWETRIPNFINLVSVVVETTRIQDLKFNASLFKSGNFTWNRLPGTKYSVGSSRLKMFSDFLTSVSITHTSEDVRFATFVHGHKDLDGYGYVAGTRMVDINCNRLFQSKMERGDNVDNDCDGRIDEENENGLDDDGDGTIDEDLKYVRSDCNFSSIVEESKQNYENVFLNDTLFKYSVTYGDCENEVKRVWYVNSSTGSAIILAVQKMKWIKPKFNVTFPPDTYVDRLNISALEELRPRLSSLCPNDTINITYNESHTLIGEKISLIRRLWTVREDCGRSVSGNQTIKRYLDGEEGPKQIPESEEGKLGLVWSLGLGFGCFVLALVVTSFVIIWRKYVSRRVVISVHIDVLEAVEAQCTYTNTAAVEECVYSEINRNIELQEKKSPPD